MRLYPAIRAQMGDWTYYIVRMKMREIAHEVKFAHDIYEDHTLSDAVQRTLNGKRVKNEIVGYLARRPDRFFSSIVVAAMDGEPAWTPVEMDDAVVPRVFRQSKPLSESFGVLSFGEEPKYYALDGQHRVKAIKLLVEGNETEYAPPDGFFDDMLSVIVVLREEHDVPEGEWLRRYRRLFSSLNRYAKPTDRDTNIIMDEDDMFAILTRRLITDHPFFQAPGRQKESHKVKTEGKNVRSNDAYFTSLQTLYTMNETLLSTQSRQLDESPVNKQIRPTEEVLDQRYTELENYWDALLLAVPELKENPSDMRHHATEGKDSLLFWPIGQELFIEIVRDFLDDVFGSKDPTVKEMADALSLLSRIPWQLHQPPWRHLILVREPRGWRMRNESRKEAILIAKRILSWILDLDPLNIDETAELREDWIGMLYSIDLEVPANQVEIEAMWKRIQEMSESTLS